MPTRRRKHRNSNSVPPRRSKNRPHTATKKNSNSSPSLSTQGAPEDGGTRVDDVGGVGEGVDDDEGEERTRARTDVRDGVKHERGGRNVGGVGGGVDDDEGQERTRASSDVRYGVKHDRGGRVGGDGTSRVLWSPFAEFFPFLSLLSCILKLNYLGHIYPPCDAWMHG